MELSESLEKIFGRMYFCACLGDRRFAEIRIEENTITIEIVDTVGFLEALLIHIFRKHRFSSRKLGDLKKAGYRVKIKYGRLEKEI